MAHVNLPQLSLPANYAAPIMHWHDFPPHAPSRAAQMPEYSATSVIRYSDDSSDESDSNRRSPPRCRNTRMRQYTNSPQYDHMLVSLLLKAILVLALETATNVHRRPHSAGSVVLHHICVCTKFWFSP